MLLIAGACLAAAGCAHGVDSTASYLFGDDAGSATAAEAGSPSPGDQGDDAAPPPSTGYDAGGVTSSTPDASGTDAVVAFDASGGEDGGSSGFDAGDAAPVGVVVFENIVFEGSAFAGSPPGVFWADFFPPGFDEGCAQTTFGSCAALKCPASVAGTLESAGTLSLGGGAIGTANLPFQAAMNGGEYDYSTQAAMFAPGDTLSVAATGATVPSFTHSVTAPAGIALTAPVPGDAGAYTIATSQDLAVSWTGGQAGDEAIIALVGNDASGNLVEARCHFDAAAGQGTVPSGAMASLAGANQGAYLAARQAVTSTFATGPWSVELTAISAVVTAASYAP